MGNSSMNKDIPKDRIVELLSRQATLMNMAITNFVLSSNGLPQGQVIQRLTQLYVHAYESGLHDGYEEQLDAATRAVQAVIRVQTDTFVKRIESRPIFKSKKLPRKQK